eukprot:11136325-Alexandrium_andersonii.AAC.1
MWQLWQNGPGEVANGDCRIEKWHVATVAQWNWRLGIGEKANGDWEMATGNWRVQNDKLQVAIADIRER